VVPPEAVWQFVKDKGIKYVASDEALLNLITTISRRIKMGSNSDKPYPEIPAPKGFDKDPYAGILSQAYKGMPNRELEALGKKVAVDLLEKAEGFTGVVEGPAFPGTPFDLFGHKGDMPYIIELKCSLVSFNHPGEVQKLRLQELLRRIEGLGVALLQMNLSAATYRIFYDDQLDLLFHGKKRPLGPVEKWIRERL